LRRTIPESGIKSRGGALVLLIPSIHTYIVRDSVLGGGSGVAL